ncbi:MAG: permease-like cell division protein FtsX [Candidatus Zixiibacteriota bacterium]
MSRAAHTAMRVGRNLRHNAGTAAASLLSLTLLFLLFDFFWIAAGTADRFYRDLLSELRVEVFVDEAVSDSTLTGIADWVMQIDGVINCELISRDLARQRLADMVGTDLLVGYEQTNPLPRSYMLTVQDDFRNGAAMAKLEQGLRTIAGLSEIHYSREWLDKAERAKEVIFQIGLVLGVLIFAGALVSSANNIRLMTRAQAVGFRQMLLLGAGRVFLSLPFLIESFLISGVAALLGWALIFYGRTRIGLAQIDIVFPSTNEIALFCAGAALLGAVSGLLGLRKMLRD